MCSKQNGAKGQVFTIDFIMAMIVFVVCIAFVNSFWQNSADSVNLAVSRDRTALAASSASEALLASPGYPADCELNNASCVAAIGLAKEGSKNELSGKRLSEFQAMNYTNSKKFLGLSNSMDYYFYVNDSGPTKLYEKGINSTIGATEVAAVSRTAVLNGTIVKVMVRVWQ